MSRIIRAAACMLPLVVGGCAASVSGIREREPTLIADSTQGAKVVTDCVSDAWQARGSSPRSIPRSNGSSITVEQPGIFYNLPVMVLDADTTPTGSHVTFHLFKTISGRSNRARVEEVKACL